MNGETFLSGVVIAVLLSLAGYGVGRWILGLVQGPVRGGACGSCGAARTCAGALGEGKATDPNLAPEALRETVWYVSDLTAEKGLRVQAGLLAREGVVAATFRPETGTIQVTYRPRSLSPSNLANLLEQLAGPEKGLPAPPLGPARKEG